MADLGASYTDTLDDLREFRNNNGLTLDEDAEKYADCKPIMMLVRWGFLEQINDNFDDGSYGGQKLAVKNSVKDRFGIRLRNLKIYNIDMDYGRPHIDTHHSGPEQAPVRISGTPGKNVLFYGVPGSGKSWTIKTEYCNDESFIERIVFHPDYTHSDFIGQILPVVENGLVKYSFTPGPFTKIIKRAVDDPDNSYFLIIEEINRGNAPAIFGEVFQLLDRKPDGASEYGITNSDMASVIYGDTNQKVYIPSNLFILGTMNTSDQNVFTLDTAFQRRWEMRQVENSFDNHPFSEKKILDTDVTWGRFCKVINDIIIDKNSHMTSSEDKRIGAYFVSEDVLLYIPAGEHDNNSRAAAEHNNLFAEKVIKYLWDDAFKFSRDDIFKNTIYKTLDDVLARFNAKDQSQSRGNDRFDIFKQEIIDALLSAPDVINNPEVAAES